MIFYFGHTAALYVNKLVLAGLLQVCLKDQSLQIREVDWFNVLGKYRISFEEF